MDVRQILEQGIAGATPHPAFPPVIPSTDTKHELLCAVKDQSVHYPELALRAVIALSSEPDVTISEVRKMLSGVRQELNWIGAERLGLTQCAVSPQTKSAKKGN